MKDWQIALFIPDDIYENYKEFLLNGYNIKVKGNQSMGRSLNGNLLSEAFLAAIKGTDINPKKIIEEYIEKNRK